MRAGVALCLAVLLSGCNEGANFSYRVGADPDHFEFSGTMETTTTRTYDYPWATDHGAADVSWFGKASQGSVTVLLDGASGERIYSNTFSVTDGGHGAPDHVRSHPGTWTITIILRDFRGEMGLLLQGSS